MSNLIEYNLKLAVSLTAFYLFYRILLSRDTHFLLNRLILIFSLLVSVILPFLPNWIVNKPLSLNHLPTLNLNLDSSESFPAVTLHPGVVNGLHSHIGSIIFWSYFTGAFLVLMRLIYQAVFIHALARLSEKVRYKSYTLVRMHGDMLPFSYFKRIYIPSGTFDDSSFDNIVAHEKSHLYQGHYFDLFLVEAMTILQWFNPIIWLYERSVKEIHEYLADRSVIQRVGNPGRYHALMVNMALGGPVFILTNPFNQSLIKKRIQMMKKMKSPEWAKLKALLILPLVAFLMAAFVSPAANVHSIKSGQGIVVSGKLSDKVTGGVLPGVIIVIKGTHEGVITDNLGRYAIRVSSPDAILVYSRMGYKTQEIPIEGSTEINVQMDENAMVVDLDHLNAQNSEESRTEEEENSNTDQKLMVTTEEFPKYKGGLEALKKYLDDNIQYPELARKNQMEGKVYVNFIVDTQGKVKNAQVIRSVAPAFNSEALRLVNQMQNWQPAIQNGKPVEMAVTLPIDFKLK